MKKFSPVLPSMLSLVAVLFMCPSAAVASSFADIEAAMKPAGSISGKSTGAGDTDTDQRRRAGFEGESGLANGSTDGESNGGLCCSSSNSKAANAGDTSDAVGDDAGKGGDGNSSGDQNYTGPDPYAWNDGLGGADVPFYTGSTDGGLFGQNTVYTSLFTTGINGAIPLRSAHLLDLNNPPSLKGNAVNNNYSSTSIITYIEHYVLAGGKGNRGTFNDESSIFYSQNDGDVLRFVLKLEGFSDWEIDLMMVGKWDIPSEAYANMNDLQSQAALNLTLNPVPLSVMTLSGVAFESGYTDGLTPTARWGAVRGMIEGDGKLAVADGCTIRTATPTVKTSVSQTFSNYDGDIKKKITTIRDVNILVDTVSGSSAECLAVDGGKSKARYGTINAIAGNPLLIIIADGNAIRRIDMGVATTISGQYDNGGFRDGELKDALFSAPGGVATDGTDVFVSDTGNNMIRRLRGGKVYTVAGNQTAGNTDGKAGEARFNAPTHLYAQGTFLIVYDSNNSTFRRVDMATSVVSTLPGVYPNVTAIAFNGNNLFFAGGGLIQVMNLATGKVSAVAGDGQNRHADGIAGAAQFEYIGAMYADGFDLWVLDGQTLRVVIGAGVSGIMPTPGLPLPVPAPSQP